MPISQEAISKILDIEDKIYLTPEEMADKLNITFFPYDKNKNSKEVIRFAQKLENTLTKLKANIVPYDKALSSNYFFLLKRIIKILLFTISGYTKSFLKNKQRDPLIPSIKTLLKIKFGKKIKSGIAIIAVGDNGIGKLPMDKTISFIKNQIITIVDMPEGIGEKNDFKHHFETGLKLFSFFMTHIVIGVTKDKWILYNMNASHSIHSVDDKNFESHILKELIPKIYAPIKPPRFSDFLIRNNSFNPLDEKYKVFIDDIVNSGKIFEQTNLYPQGKKIEDLPFRNELYKWIGNLHLDGRNGMSYGFLARQLPTMLSDLMTYSEAKKRFPNSIFENKDYFINEKKLYLIIELFSEKMCLMVPDVWVLTQRSGSKKTNINPSKDIIRMGLINGDMILDMPKSYKINLEYRPSFDTRVILSHALGNAIVASILNYYHPDNVFSKSMQDNGMAIAHWHGYFNKDSIPSGWYMYGYDNPHVPCSAPQSSIYALDGKIKVLENILQNKKEFLGDIHIEPQHGINVNFSTLSDLGSFLIKNPDATRLGNYYFEG